MPGPTLQQQERLQQPMWGPHGTLLLESPMMLAIISWTAGDRCKAVTVAKVKANQAQSGACSAADGNDLKYCVADLQEAQHI